MASRACGYNLPGVEVDGNDVLAVYQAAGEAIQNARQGNGPTLLECHTYRTRAHAEGMRDAGYRTQEEIDSWKARDPIRLFKENLLLDGSVAAADIEALEAELLKIAEDATQFARQSPLPDPSTVALHVFAES